MAILYKECTYLLIAVNDSAIPAVLRASEGRSLMPPFNPLSECAIREFEIWIENLMPE
jgi:hypothetical protein